MNSRNQSNLFSQLQDFPTPDVSTPSFNPGLLNPRLFNHETLNPRLDSYGVEKLMEWSGVEKSGVEMSCYLL
jgi:hypothetical protein